MKKIRILVLGALCSYMFSCSDNDSSGNDHSNYVVFTYEFVESPVDKSISVQFHSETKDEGVISWDFGDGTTSSELDPVKRYDATGTYRVSISKNSRLYYFREIFVAIGCQSAELGIKASQSDENTTHIAFDLKLDESQSSRLVFGDGTSVSILHPSELLTISHTYYQRGNYCVELTGSNGSCASTVVSL